MAHAEELQNACFMLQSRFGRTSGHSFLLHLLKVALVYVDIELVACE